MLPRGLLLQRRVVGQEAKGKDGLTGQGPPLAYSRLKLGITLG